MPNVITNDVTPPVIRIEGVRKDYTMGDNSVAQGPEGSNHA